MNDTNIYKKDAQLHEEIQDGLNKFEDIVQAVLAQPRESNKTNYYDRSLSIVNKLVIAINEFEMNPKLIEPGLANYITYMTETFLKLHSNESSVLTQSVGKVIYNLSKICGFKNITTYFSSDVYLIPRLMALTMEVKDDNELFLCLMWLSNLVLVPFKLEDIDPMLVNQLYALGLTNLTKHFNASKNQMASSILLSRLVSRPDLHEAMLPKYFGHIESMWSEINGPEKLGHHITTKRILKRCTSEVVDKHLELIYKLISYDLISSRKDPECLNSLNLLYIIKLLGNIAMFHVQKANYLGLEKVINNLLNDVLSTTDNFSTTLRYGSSKSLSQITEALGRCAVNYQEQLTLFVIEQFEIPNIRIDYSPYTKSRKTNNPFQSDLDIQNDHVVIPKYHTLLLFLGNVCLKKSLQVHLIPVVLSIVHKTLFIEQKVSNTTLGSQVRDASCFVLWALFRMIKEDTLTSLSETMVSTILLDIICLTIMDSDLTIRRCGVALMQEFLGRFGSIHFRNQFESGEKLGEFLVSLVQLFTNSSVSSRAVSFQLIESLVTLGFDQNLFLPSLVRNILQSDDFNFTKLNLEYCVILSESNVQDKSSIHSSREDVQDKSSLHSSREDKSSIHLNLVQERYDASKVLQMLTTQNLNLFAIARLLRGSDPKDIPQDIQDRVAAFSFDFHHGSMEEAEGYMEWINTFGNPNWEVIFNILRMHPSEGLQDQFRVFFSSLSALHRDHERKFQSYLKGNNITLSKVIFCCKLVPIEPYIHIIQDTNVDADIRANMIKCLGENCSHHLASSIRESIIDFLDDYTTTNQGDVGSKIRLATIVLLEKHASMFSQESHLLRTKLIRLAGELMDNVRYAAFNLFSKISGTQQYDEDTQYFKHLFTVYAQLLENYEENKQLSIELLRGLSFTIGALTSNTVVSNKAFRDFLAFLMASGLENQQNILQNLLTLLKPPQTPQSRQNKLRIVVLNVFVKLFEANLIFPSGFNYQALYIRVHNLQIGTTNLNRLCLTIKLLQFIALESNAEPELRLRAKKRIIHLAESHKLEGVRTTCGEALFEVMNEIESTTANNEFLESIDWTDQKSIKAHSGELLETFTRLDVV